MEQIYYLHMKDEQLGIWNLTHWYQTEPASRTGYDTLSDFGDSWSTCCAFLKSSIRVKTQVIKWKPCAKAVCKEFSLSMRVSLVITKCE